MRTPPKSVPPSPRRAGPGLARSSGRSRRRRASRRRRERAAATCPRTSAHRPLPPAARSRPQSGTPRSCGGRAPRRGRPRVRPRRSRGSAPPRPGRARPRAGAARAPNGRGAGRAGSPCARAHGTSVAGRSDTSRRRCRAPRSRSRPVRAELPTGHDDASQEAAPRRVALDDCRLRVGPKPCRRRRVDRKRIRGIERPRRPRGHPEAVAVRVAVPGFGHSVPGPRLRRAPGGPADLADVPAGAVASEPARERLEVAERRRTDRVGRRFGRGARPDDQGGAAHSRHDRRREKHGQHGETLPAGCQTVAHVTWFPRSTEANHPTRASRIAA